MGTEPRTTWVYALVDPRNSKIRYVGQTVNLTTRLRNHIYSPHVRVSGWIRELRDNDVRPIMVTLEETDSLRCFAIELKWIRLLLEADAPLLNKLHTTADDRAAAYCDNPKEMKEWINDLWYYGSVAKMREVYEERNHRRSLAAKGNSPQYLAPLV